MTTQEIYLVLDNIVKQGESAQQVQSNLYDFGKSLGQENIKIRSVCVKEHLQKRTFSEAVQSFVQGYMIGMFLLLDKYAKKHGSDVNDVVGMLIG